MNSSYEVDPQVLKQAAEGINEAVDELQDVGGVGSGAVGRGFSSLAMTGLQVGDSGLCKAFSDFAQRWEWGVRALVVEGNEVADKLNLSAGYYHEMEQYGQEVLKDGVTAALADPAMSGEDVEKKKMSWGDVGSSVKDAYTPDFSAESYAKAHSKVEDAWKATGEDVATSGVGGAHVRVAQDIAGQPPSPPPAEPPPGSSS